MLCFVPADFLQSCMCIAATCPKLYVSTPVLEISCLIPGQECICMNTAIERCRLPVKFLSYWKAADRMHVCPDDTRIRYPAKGTWEARFLSDIQSWWTLYLATTPFAPPNTSFGEHWFEPVVRNSVTLENKDWKQRLFAWYLLLVPKT